MLESVQNYQERLEAISGGLVEIRDLRHQTQNTGQRVVVLSHQTVYTFLSHYRGLENYDDNQLLTVIGNVDLLIACLRSILGIISSRQLITRSSKSKVLSSEENRLGALKSAGESPPHFYYLEEGSLDVCLFLKYAVAPWIHHRNWSTKHLVPPLLNSLADYLELILLSGVCSSKAVNPTAKVHMFWVSDA